jgi:aspartyl-tRNA(Asn)/glutamyl-tRNA(Gln) amidotransferase subunit A
MGKSFGLDDLYDLPAEARDGFEERPIPVAGRPPHEWADAELGPPAPDDHRVTARQMADAYQRGDLSPTEVFEAMADRIERGSFGKLVHSPYAALDIESARDAARESERRYADGEPLGPLDGIPVPIKDHHEVRGMPTGSGTTFMASEEGPATDDSEPVHRLREQGALLPGKAHATEWGLQPTGFNANLLMPRNPYDRQRGAGGSSTGTGAAVAIGLAPVGLGSDGGGSIRIPSSLCGLFGLKPTYQRISRVGDHWMGTMSHNGPIGQSTADLVDFMAVAGTEPDPEDPATELAAEPETFARRLREALGRGVEGARIGVWSWAFEQADEQIARPCMTALRALAREGAELVEIDPDFAEHHQMLGTLILGGEATGLIAEILEEFPDQTGDDVRLMTSALTAVSGRDFILANRVRAVLRRRVADTFTDVDLLAAPATNAVAPEYPLTDDRTAIYDEGAVRELCRFAFLANLTGIPAGAVPVGLVDGLPVGLQFMGDAWDEPSVVAAMAHLERLGLTELPAPDDYLSFAGP